MWTFLLHVTQERYANHYELCNDIRVLNVNNNFNKAQKLKHFLKSSVLYRDIAIKSQGR